MGSSSSNDIILSSGLAISVVERPTAPTDSASNARSFQLPAQPMVSNGLVVLSGSEADHKPSLLLNETKKKVVDAREELHDVKVKKKILLEKIQLLKVENRSFRA